MKQEYSVQGKSGTFKYCLFADFCDLFSHHSQTKIAASVVRQFSVSEETSSSHEQVLLKTDNDNSSSSLPHFPYGTLFALPLPPPRLPKKICITFFFISPGYYSCPTRNWKQCLCNFFFFSSFFLGGWGGGEGQIKCIIWNGEAAYRHLSVVLYTMYNFYLRHIVWLEISQKLTTPYPFFLWLRTPLECEQKNRVINSPVTSVEPFQTRTAVQ